MDLLFEDLNLWEDAWLPLSTYGPPPLQDAQVGLINCQVCAQTPKNLFVYLLRFSIYLPQYEASIKSACKHSTLSITLRRKLSTTVAVSQQAAVVQESRWVLLKCSHSLYAKSATLNRQQRYTDGAMSAGLELHLS